MQNMMLVALTTRQEQICIHLVIREDNLSHKTRQLGPSLRDHICLFDKEIMSKEIIPSTAISPFVKFASLTHF